MNRRRAMQSIAATGTALAGCSKNVKEQSHESTKASTSEAPPARVVLSTEPLTTGAPWPTPDPFLFCVHHDDRYPAANGRFGPAASLAGRPIGQDFTRREGWSMYHGESVPGFPAHPHRGFETVTVVRRGLLDHADSLGAAARYGQGDVQWLTAGSGIQHAEMFPLLHQSAENPVELFQIWLNLPSRRKMVAPYFSMLWANTIPTKRYVDAAGRSTEVTLRAGRLEDQSPPPPPPDSWAADAANEVAIWTVRLEPKATWTIPAASTGVNRALYFFEGDTLEVGDRTVSVAHQAVLQAEVPARIVNGDAQAEFLLLQGRPIGEPIARHGPFVMNTREEIYAAYEDYRRTQFGGWPWSSRDPVHGAEHERFARRPDGSVERPS